MSTASSKSDEMAERSQLVPAGTPRSERIAQVAKERIRHESHLAMQRIWCAVERNQLLLRGQVPSYYHKQLAQEVVAGLEGVERVVNEIEVIW